MLLKALCETLSSPDGVPLHRAEAVVSAVVENKLLQSTDSAGASGRKQWVCRCDPATRLNPTHARVPCTFARQMFLAFISLDACSRLLVARGTAQRQPLLTAMQQSNPPDDRLRHTCRPPRSANIPRDPSRPAPAPRASALQPPPPLIVVARVVVPFGVARSRSASSPSGGDDDQDDSVFEQASPVGAAECPPALEPWALARSGARCA